MCSKEKNRIKKTVKYNIRSKREKELRKRIEELEEKTEIKDDGECFFFFFLFL